MKLTTDDRIHRFSGRWIDARGTAMPVVARYPAWGIFIATAPLIGVLVLVLFDNPIAALAVGGGSGGLLAGWGADHLDNGETTLGSWWMTARAERRALTRRLTNRHTTGTRTAYRRPTK